MIGWIAAIVGAFVLLHKSQANSATTTPATTVTTSPTLGFGGVVGPPQAPAREPVLHTWQDWQNGPFVPVPTGSRMDVLPANPALISDNVKNQMIQLGQYTSGGPTIINPPTVAPVSGGGSGTSSGVGGSSGGGGGGGTSFGGGGGFNGGGRPFIA
jgi:uncharacterized membrane protein YgcG